MPHALDDRPLLVRLNARIQKYQGCTMAGIKWSSPAVKRNALVKLSTILKYAERRKKGAGKILETPFIFPPSKNSEYVRQTSDLHKQWNPILKALGMRHRPPYNCRHTYATICIMSGMNPAFISQQLGHSVQMLLSTYARWINSSSDWSELKKLQIGPKLVPAQISAT